MKLRSLCRLLLLALTAVCLAPAQPVDSAGFDDGPDHLHSRLLVYHDESGREVPVRSRADWGRRRQEILEGMQEAMGPFPKREERAVPLGVKVVETVARARHTRLTITFTPEEGDRLAAYLYVPKGIGTGERRAGILALHPTHRIGKGVVDGQSERPNRAYGRELADRGYVVIAPDYVSFGDSADYDFESDDYVSGTMKGIWNHVRSIDVLVGREDVDPERIGAIGHSLGGHNAMFVGVFDERIQAVVSSCGWCPFHDYYGGKIAGWTSSRYMPLLKTKYGLNPDRVPFDFYEVVAALAPRAFFTSSPLHDHNFDVRGVKKAMPRARRVYELLGAGDDLAATYPDAKHDFPPAARRAAYGFLDRQLQHAPAAEIP